MSTRTRIEWWTGQKLNYETADELGIAEFTSGKRPLKFYLAYQKVKDRRKADAGQAIRLAQKTGNSMLWRSVVARNKTIARNKFWREQGYPNLRRAWAARRANAARRRAEKALEAIKAQQRKELERYGL